MKVLVMDDEEKVCSLVCALILWDELGLELVGTAGDGLEGLNLIQETNPDILITDIRMPSLDGLELIERAKKINPNLQVIIISGYRQFDYAKKAIKFGVSDYLLKPIKQNELLTALEKMIANYNEKKDYKNYLSNKDDLRSYYLLNYFENKADKEKVSELFNFSNFINLSLISVDGEFYQYDLKAKEAIKTKLKTFFFTYLNDVSDWELVFSDKYHGYILFITFDENQYDIIIKNIKKAFKEAVINFSSLFSNIELTLSQGSHISDFDKVFKEIERIINLSYTRINNNCDNYIDEFQIPLTFDSDEIDSFILKINSLYANEKLNMDEFNLLINNLYMIDENMFFLTIEAIVNRLFVIFKNQVNKEDVEKLSFDRIYYLNSKNKIISFFKEKLLLIYNLLLEKRNNDSAKPIKDAQNYIEKHYWDNQLSLDTLSELVHLSPTYFSSLFKKETNKGFAEYLREVRINKATQILINTSLPIKEVSKQVGYQDSRHFTKCFKNQLGIKPQDYRKLYG
ncbi:MAG: response regulator transcription factor [Pleomorphochaeta sp.]